MSSPSSCSRCFKSQARLALSGLCQECAATGATPVPTSPARPPADLTAVTATGAPQIEPGTEGPTESVPPAPVAVSGAVVSRRPMPESPSGLELLRALGGGGMGDVYLARECPSGRSVALKFLKHPEHSTAHSRFVTELQTLAELKHPNIVGVFAADFMRAVPFFTMEYAAGGSLSDAVGARRPSPEEAVQIIRVVAGAVAAAHAKGTIHRDLKPSNVLLFGGPQEWAALKVADFGLAKRLDTEDSVGITYTNETLGTPGYMPPEQVSRANGEVDRRADVYGLGATFYHVLTGRAPFVGATRPDVIQQVLADAPTRVRALRPEVSLRLEAIVLKCLAKDPADRYESVDALLAELDKYEAGLRPAAPLMTRPRRARLWVSRNRRRLAGAVAAATVLVATGLLLALPSEGPQPLLPIPDEIRGPDGRLLPFRVRLGHDKSKVTVAADGTVTISSWGMCLVEHIPATPRSDRYALRADIRHEASDRRGWAGLYFSHQAFPGAFGETHVLGRLTYNDQRLSGDTIDAVVPPPSPIPVPVENRVRLSAMVHKSGRERPSVGQMELASGAPFRPAGASGLWRPVELRVAPDGADAVWDGRPVAPAAASRFEAVFAEKLADSRKRNPDDPPPATGRFDPKAGFGLMVESSSVSFRKVEMRDLSNGNR